MDGSALEKVYVVVEGEVTVITDEGETALRRLDSCWLAPMGFRLRTPLWVDGQLIADFPNFRFRDVESLKIDVFGIALFIRPNNLRENRKWFDEVVAATSYIGPMAEPKKARGGN